MQNIILYHVLSVMPIKKRGRREVRIPYDKKYWTRKKSEF